MIRSILLLAIVPVLTAQEAPPAATAAAAQAASSSEVMLRTPEEPGRFKNFFQPFRTDTAALSPDGKYLAYSVREDEMLSVVIIDLADPEKIKTRVKVVDDAAATPMLAANQQEKTPCRINWMRWATATRLVVETNEVHTETIGSQWSNWSGIVLAFDADGANARRIANPKDVFESITTTKTDGKDFFSIKRDTSAKFSRHVATPDEPMPVLDPEEDKFDGFARLSDNPLEITDPILNQADLSASGILPRSLRIFDLDPDRPGAVKLLASGTNRDSGNRLMSAYSLDATTGKLTTLNDDFILNTNDPMFDRQGHIRVTLPNTTRSSLPLHYTYLGLKGQNRPKPLDETTGLTGFQVAPENYFGERTIPVGFDENPSLLYYASNVGRDTYGLYSLDLLTKQRGSVTMENSSYDLISPPTNGFLDQRVLVFDRYQHKLVGVRYENALRTTAWIKPELQAMQADFEKMFPGRTVEITDWDEAGRHYIVTTEGPADPGAFFVYDRDTNKLLEFVRRAPWIDANHIHRTLPFSYLTADKNKISGLVTVPQKPLFNPIPMVVLCPDLPWQRVRSDFQTEVQALADMGFVVVQLNGRGAWGLGLKQRQSLTAGYDLVQVEDIVTTITNLEKIFKVNPKRVALMGRGHGGFIALRALQIYPDKFRCAIALDAPVDLAGWLNEQKWSNENIQPLLTRAWIGDKARLQAAPLVSHPEAITKPVLMFNYPGPDGTPRPAHYAAALHLADRIRSKGTECNFFDLKMDYMKGLPAARAAVFDEIEGFLNTNVYNYKVKLQELKVIDKDVKSP